MVPRWQAIRKEATDIHSSRLTYWNEQTLYASRLDRIYVSTPGWLLLNVVVEAYVIGDVLRRHLRGPSDHIPVGVRFAAVARRPPSQSSIPAWVCQAESFAALLDLFMV